MKLAVQPAGATMQPAAETPAWAKPGHSVLSVSIGSCLPLAPASMTCCLSWGVSQAGAGLGSVRAPVAADDLPETTRNSDAMASSAGMNLMREDTVPPWLMVLLWRSLV